MPSSIQVSRGLRERLKAHKTHPRQPYEEVIAMALDLLEEDEMELSADTHAAIRQGRRDRETGRTKSLDDVANELGL